MISIIVVGHGHFASGILSSLELIAGKQNKLIAIDFTADMTSDDVQNCLISVLNLKEETLILCDLLGGTPFKVAASLMENLPTAKINVLAGLNLAMLIEATFARQTELSLEQLTASALTASKEGVIDWQSFSESKYIAADSEEDGI